MGSPADAPYGDVAIIGGLNGKRRQSRCRQARRVRMRRMMLGMSQEKLGDVIGITFQQVQKYENGKKNRISASRPQHISQILQVPVPFFFEGAPGGTEGAPGVPSYINEFLATSDGLALTKAFMRIENAKLRRLIVHLVEDCAEL
jgi:transcriptional regulator with XRE-family HTH domain